MREDLNEFSADFQFFKVLHSSTPGPTRLLGKSRHIRFQDLPENAQDPLIIVGDYENIRICISKIRLKLKIGRDRRVWTSRSTGRLDQIVLVSVGILGVGKRANRANYVQRIKFFISYTFYI